MTIFVDASAMVALLTHEPEGPELGQMIEADRDRLWSAMTGWEVIAALKNNYRFTIESARVEAERVASALDFRMVEIGHRELSIALDAYRAFGKGQHRARLNFGDCFAYACAKANGAKLLYKGDDFAHTDLA